MSLAVIKANNLPDLVRASLLILFLDIIRAASHPFIPALAVIRGEVQYPPTGLCTSESFRRTLTRRSRSVNIPYGTPSLSTITLPILLEFITLQARSMLSSYFTE